MPSKELQAYRQVQARIAAQRDAGLCVFHYFGSNQRVRAADAHHMFGRGKRVNNPKENYTRIVSVCRACHPQPIIHPNEEDHAYLLWVWMNANQYPIDKSFIHPVKYLKFSSEILMNETWLKYLEYYERTP